MFAMTIETLSHGWADLHLDIGQQNVMYYFENVPNDALADILLSANRIIGIGPDSIIIFPNGAQKSTMRVQSVDKATSRVTFENEVLTISKEQFAKAVLKMFDKYVHENSLEAYKSEWGNFPSEELEKLRNSYHAV